VIAREFWFRGNTIIHGGELSYGLKNLLINLGE
jgi:hypothetical protein